MSRFPKNIAALKCQLQTLHNLIVFLFPGPCSPFPILPMNSSPPIQKLVAQVITADNFRPYGQAIFAIQDGDNYDTGDAQLVLDRGTPRFYIMRLHQNGRQFHKITRHCRCTQCLGSLEGQEWLLAVAPPSPEPEPNLEKLAAFRIPGNCFVKLEVGTWHAGPHIDSEFVDFYNLELSDTNINDHDTCNLLERKNAIFEII